MSAYEPFDDRAKEFYRRLFVSWGMQVETELEVFFRGRSIDLVVQCTDGDLQRLQETVFSHFRYLNALELKGIRDPLRLKNFSRAMMRIWGLGALALSAEMLDDEETDEEDSDDDETLLLPSSRTVTMVCVTRPTKILDWLQDEFLFFPTDQPGIYRCKERISQWIIHPTELELIPRNYALLPLARGEKLSQFIDICVREGLVDYLQLILDIGLATDPDVIWHKILEMTNMKPMIREDTWPYIDQFLQATPEALLKVPTFREALAESERRGVQRGEQQTLMYILRHRFGEIPDPIIQRIEAATDPDQLKRWIDQALDVSTLAEIPFITSSN